ncbi:MAG: STAS domain-containing protein [Nitrococcus sp.]|nr:STAS domain-containing protein [Nitrococcus sp.]
MSAARVAIEGEEGQLALLGALTFETVPGLSKELAPVLRQHPRLRIDLSALERVDSAGLALLTEWTRLTRALGHCLEFINIPEQLLTIARVSGLDQMLPFRQAQSGGDALGRHISGGQP